MILSGLPRLVKVIVLMGSGCMRVDYSLTEIDAFEDENRRKSKCMVKGKGKGKAEDKSAQTDSHILDYASWKDLPLYHETPSHAWEISFTTPDDPAQLTAASIICLSADMVRSIGLIRYELSKSKRRILRIVMELWVPNQLWRVPVDRFTRMNRKQSQKKLPHFALDIVYPVVDGYPVTNTSHTYIFDDSVRSAQLNPPSPDDPDDKELNADRPSRRHATVDAVIGSSRSSGPSPVAADSGPPELLECDGTEYGVYMRIDEDPNSDIVLVTAKRRVQHILYGDDAIDDSEELVLHYRDLFREVQEDEHKIAARITLCAFKGEALSCVIYYNTLQKAVPAVGPRGQNASY
ncbi:hypothetical protein OBBRIDRAFT_125602 [Obba rivulosa]|uniref:Uncharacterized protein n=1 Tax=Obba rivulosa TaxID=1052685 RepID=A0A8E2DRJ0_9APHY|nr:hypothetical protein OBBRIDRAFT_125602 [Obba rivulosa]